MSADTMKRPEPIIEPATIMVESRSPSPRTNFVSVGAAIVSVAGIRAPVFVSSCCAAQLNTVAPQRATPKDRPAPSDPSDSSDPSDYSAGLLRPCRLRRKLYEK